MCNCIQEKEEALKNKFGYRSVAIDSDICSGRISVGFGGVDKDGKVFDSGKMLVSYCPFCGTKYLT